MLLPVYLLPLLLLVLPPSCLLQLFLPLPFALLIGLGFRLHLTQRESEPLP